MFELLGFVFGYVAFALLYARRLRAAIALVVLSGLCWSDVIGTLLTLMAAGSVHILVMPLVGKRR